MKHLILFNTVMLVVVLFAQGVLAGWLLTLDKEGDMVNQATNLERMQRQAFDAPQRVNDVIRIGRVTRRIGFSYDVEFQGAHNKYTIEKIPPAKSAHITSEDVIFLLDSAFGNNGWRTDSEGTVISPQRLEGLFLLPDFEIDDLVYVQIRGGDLRRGALIVGKV